MTPRLPEALSFTAFAPFGDVIEVREGVRHYPINGGTTERYHELTAIDLGRDGRGIVSIFRGQPRPLPLRLEVMERHPLASQAFVPLSGHPYLVVVAPAGEAPTPGALRIFLARPDQGVNYAPGVWHHPLLALEATSDFLVIDRTGPGDNCDEVALPHPIVVDIARER